MRYNKYTVETTTAAEDIIVSTLADLGVEGAQIEDKIPLTEDELAGMFVDIMPSAGEDDGKAYISFYLDADEDHTELLGQIKAEFEEHKEVMDVGSCRNKTEVTEDEDFLNNWKQYFHKFYIDDILFIPSWEEAEKPPKTEMVIHIDPGTAFGTGMHETTQLCIKALRKYVTYGCSVADIGTGSGVLSILAFKFGAGRIVATDLDPCARDASSENMAANGLSDSDFTFIEGNLIDDERVQSDVGTGYDIAVANILAQVLIPLMPSVKKCLKPGGIYIMSGIIDDKEEEVINECAKCGFAVLEVSHQGEWVGVGARNA